MTSSAAVKAKARDQSEPEPSARELRCSCGTFAIGRCSECERLVCGEHSGILSGQRLCYEHYQAMSAKLEAEREPEWRKVFGHWPKDPHDVKQVMDHIVNRRRDAREEDEAKIRAEEERLVRLELLIEKFLEVMAKAGNPGAHRVGLWRGPGWIIANGTRSISEMGAEEYWIFLTTKGQLYQRTDHPATDKWKLDDLSTYAESSLVTMMAETLLKHGVEWPDEV